MTKITEIENLIENYPFLQAIDKVDSIHAYEILTNVGDSNELINTKHDTYQITAYDKEPIGEKDYEIQLTQILLPKLEREARDTFYINFSKFCSNVQLNKNFREIELLSTIIKSNDKIILDTYKNQIDSDFRRFTKMFVRQTFQNWSFVVETSTFDIDHNTRVRFPKFKNVSEELQDSKIYGFGIQGRFGFQKFIIEPREKNFIHYTLLASDDLIGYINEKDKYDKNPYDYESE
jgi:hypothetical protein